MTFPCTSPINPIHIHHPPCIDFQKPQLARKEAKGSARVSLYYPYSDYRLETFGSASSAAAAALLAWCGAGPGNFHGAPRRWPALEPRRDNWSITAALYFDPFFSSSPFEERERRKPLYFFRDTKGVLVSFCPSAYIPIRGTCARLDLVYSSSGGCVSNSFHLY